MLWENALSLLKMITEDQYAGMLMSHKSLQRELEEWKRKYHDVADAITRESFGVKDLCAQARAIRKARDKYRDELQNIANAKPHTWGAESDQFQAWAQNRAMHALSLHDKAD